MCRTSLVSPEQPVLCIPVRPTDMTVLIVVTTGMPTDDYYYAQL